MTDGGVRMPRPVLYPESATAPAAAASQIADEISAPTYDEIAELAYSYWEARGGQGGSPWEDWFRAERELKKQDQL
jgi:hypothetical protein